VYSEEKQENDDIIKPQSIEILSFGGKITPKQANFLNQFFLRECDKYPLYKLVSEYPEPTRKHLCSPRDEYLVYLGRQLGEQWFRPSFKDESQEKVEISAYPKVSSFLKRKLKLSHYLSEKYFNLNQEGYFKQFKNETLREYWLRRIGYDLKDYKELLKKGGLL